VSPLNEHGDMIAISAYYRLASDFVAKLQTAAQENEALRNEVDEQARLNGKGSEREAALLAKVSDLQRQLDNARTDWLCDTCRGRGCEAENQNAALLAELEKLQRENVEMRSDKHRLDWINEHRPQLDRWQNMYFVGSRYTRDGHVDIREAIDAEIKREQA